MRLIDADALLDAVRQTNRYFDIKFDIESAPTIDDNYKGLYDAVCNINNNLMERLDMYHKQFMLDQAEIKMLREKIKEFEEEK